MRLVIFAVFVLAVTINPSLSAVSGYWETSKILHAILGENDLADELKQQPIESITATRTGYRVQSRDCAVDVNVKVEPAGHPGPAEFTIYIGRGSCR